MRFAFGLHTDGLFFVMVDAVTKPAAGTKTCSWMMQYPSEDDLLRRIVFADLEPKDEQRMLTAVLVGVARAPATTLEWVDVELTIDQIEELGLNAGQIDLTGIEAPAQSVGSFLTSTHSGSLA